MNRKRVVGSAALISSLTMMMLFFQNCSSGFEVVGGQPASSGSIDPTNWRYTFELQENFFAKQIPSNLVVDVETAKGALMVGTALGLSFSKDGGNTWKNLTTKDGLSVNSIESIRTNGDIVNLAGYGRVVRFDPVTEQIYPHPATLIKNDPIVLESMIYYALPAGSCEYLITYAQLLKTCDGNKSYTELKRLGDTPLDGRNLAVDGEKIVFSVVDPISKFAVLMVSNDGGANFVSRPSPASRLSFGLRGLVTTAGKIFVATSSEPDCNFFSSSDDGNSWACASTSADVGFVNKLSVANGYIWISGNSGLMKYDLDSKTMTPTIGTTNFTFGHAALNGKIYSATRFGLDVFDSSLILKLNISNSLTNRAYSVRKLVEDKGLLYIGSPLGWAVLDSKRKQVASHNLSGRNDGALTFEDDVRDLHIVGNKLFIASAGVSVADTTDQLGTVKKLSSSASALSQTYAFVAFGKRLFAIGNWGVGEIDLANDTINVNQNKQSISKAVFVGERLLMYNAGNEFFVSNDFGINITRLDLSSICRNLGVFSLTSDGQRAQIACGNTLFESQDLASWTEIPNRCSTGDKFMTLQLVGEKKVWGCQRVLIIESADGTLETLEIPKTALRDAGDFLASNAGDTWYFASTYEGLISAKKN